MADENVATQPEDENIGEGPVEASDGEGMPMTGEELEEAREAEDEFEAKVADAIAAPEPEDGAVEDMIAQAVEISYADFQKRHFMTAKMLTARMGNPVEFLTETLTKDEAYRALLASTESDIEAAKIGRIVVKVALRLAEKIIIAL